jgi:hypothetical protein
MFVPINGGREARAGWEHPALGLNVKLFVFGGQKIPAAERLRKWCADK